MALAISRERNRDYELQLIENSEYLTLRDKKAHKLNESGVFFSLTVVEDIWLVCLFYRFRKFEVRYALMRKFVRDHH